MPPWRRILFVEAVLILLLFLLISGYVFWRVLPLDQYCDHLHQCVELLSWSTKIKLALGAATLFVYSFLGPLAVLCAIPFLLLWLHWLFRHSRH